MLEAQLMQGARFNLRNFMGHLGMVNYGNVFFVDPGNGSDTTNSGTSPDKAFATVTKALTVMTANQDDVLVLCGTSSTGRTAETAAINWNKRRTHIIGVSGLTRKMNPRNGISFGAGISGSCFTVSAADCTFQNISIATFQDNNVLTEITADYNTFKNVHFQGIGHDTTGDDTAARSLLLTGCGENEFYNCTIGLDTVTRSAANASLELTGSCPRNKFFGCDFPMYADNAGAFWVKADTGNCYERFLLFEDCNFYNPVTTGSSTALTAGFKLSATGNGDVRLRNCSWRGATDLSTDYTCLFSNMPVYDTQDAGVTIAVTS